MRSFRMLSEQPLPISASLTSPPEKAVFNGKVVADDAKVHFRRQSSAIPTDKSVSSLLFWSGGLWARTTELSIICTFPSTP